MAAYTGNFLPLSPFHEQEDIQKYLSKYRVRQRNLKVYKLLSLIKISHFLPDPTTRVFYLPNVSLPRSRLYERVSIISGTGAAICTAVQR
jgi:hypothetical protein